MKNLIYILIGVSLVVSCGASLTYVGHVEGDALHTMQSAWAIVETENSAETQTDELGASERTKSAVDALIAANTHEEAYISVYAVPPKWNGVRFRAAGITAAGTVTHQIYLGSLGRGLDCELSYAGQFEWVIGTQDSIYDQITFTDGGTYKPQIGDTVTGNTSGETAVIVSIVESASTWSAGTAAGTVTYRSVSGTFTDAETVSIVRANKVLSDDAYKHANSVFLDFELADTLTVTSKAWGSSWSAISPADDTNAEAELDFKGADLIVVVTTASSVDSKLFIKGY